MLGNFSPAGENFWELSRMGAEGFRLTTGLGENQLLSFLTPVGSALVSERKNE